MSEDISEVVITADSFEWLTAFTRRLVEDRLAACGQHISQVHSVYRWQGDIESADEVRVAIHTRTALVPRIVERANSEHPYDVPCVIAFPVTGANPAYARWVTDETTAE